MALLSLLILWLHSRPYPLASPIFPCRPPLLPGQRYIAKPSEGRGAGAVRHFSLRNMVGVLPVFLVFTKWAAPVHRDSRDPTGL